MNINKWNIFMCFVAASIVIAACARAVASRTGSTRSPIETASETSVPKTKDSQDKIPATQGDDTPGSTPSPTEPRPDQPAPTNERIEDPNQYNFPQLLPYDGIRPVYDPEFAPAVDAPLLDEELVMGIAIQGEAKAYPVTVLRFREMVNDELAGLPILVTW